MGLIHAVSDRIFRVTPSWRGVSDQSKFTRRTEGPKILYNTDENISVSKIDFRHSFFCKVPRLQTFVLLLTATCGWTRESSIFGMTMNKANTKPEEKRGPVPLCLPHILYWLAWNSKQAAALQRQRLAAWNMTRRSKRAMIYLNHI